MALPNKKIKQIQLPGDISGSKTYEIIPERLGKNGHSAELPTLSSDSTIALTSDLDSYIQKSVLTAAGDIIYASNGSTPVSLGIGQEGQVLTVNSQGLPEWNNASVGTVTDVQINTDSILTGSVASFNTKSAYNKDTNKILTEADIVNKLDTSFSGASNYNSTLAYTVGSKVLYSSKLYKCTTATPDPAGDFDLTKWTEVTIADYVDLTSDQTVGGAKTFTDTVEVDSKLRFGASSSTTKWFQKAGTYLALGQSTNQNILYFGANVIYPASNDFNLGLSSNKFKDLYLAGRVNPITYNGNQVGLKFPDTSSFTEDKILVTEDRVNELASNKADKVTSATADDLAGLDSTGNLTDSGIAISDVVTRSGTQTISGEKTFNNNVIIGANYKLAIEGSNAYSIGKSGNNMVLSAWNDFEFGSYNGNITNLIPQNGKTGNLGTSSRKWSKAYIQEIYPSTYIEPLTDSAVRLGHGTRRFTYVYTQKIGNENQSYGLIVPSTTNYTADKTIATVEDMYGFPVYDNTATYAIGDKVIYNGIPYRCTTAITMAEDFDSSKWIEISLNNYVDLTSEQTISGIKTFLGSVKVKRASDGGGHIYLNPDSNGSNGKIGFSSGGCIMIHNGGIQSDKSFYPMYGNSSVNLGHSSYKWNNLYLKGSLIDDNDNSISIAQLTNNSFFGASAYDATATYAVGDKVVYQNKLYVCNTAIETAEAWNSSHWTEITLADYVDLTSNQTIGGTKTFTNGLNTSHFTFGETDENNWYFKKGNVNIEYGTLASKYTRLNYVPILSTQDLGASDYYWRDLYLSGQIKLKGGTREAFIISDSTSGLIIRDGATGGGIKTGYISGVGASIVPYASNTSLGKSDATWLNLYLSGTAYFGNTNVSLTKDSSNDRLFVNINGYTKANFGSSTSTFSTHVNPDANDSYDLGSGSLYWRNLQLSGNLTDGTNSITIASIQEKVPVKRYI